MCCSGRDKLSAKRKVSKGFNFVRGKVLFGCADLRFAEPQNSLRGRTDCYFLRRAKSNIKSTRDSVLRPRFKALSKKISAKFSGNTSRTRFFAQNGGEKALNRCDVWVLQRKELKRTSKEEPHSLRTVGYGWVGICGVGCGNWRRLRTVKWLIQIDSVLVAKKTCFFSLCKANQ